MFRIIGVMTLLLVFPFALGASTPSYPLDKDPMRLGRKALEEGRWADAARAFQEAVDAGYQVPKATFGLAEVANHEGRAQDAEALYRRAILGAGKFPEAHAALGLLLLRQGREKEADDSIAQALSEDANLWTAQYGRARLLLVLKRPEDGKAFLDRGAKRKGVKDGEDLYHHGMALYWIETGKLDQAEQEALSAFALNPAQPEISLLVGRVYQLRKTPYLAVQAFETALAAPGAMATAPLLDQLGRLYEEIGQPNQARDTYLKAVTADSTYAPALLDLAHLFQRAGQPESAARAYLRYLTLLPHDVDALVGLANACFETARMDEALTAAQKALAEDSTRADVKLAFVRSGLRSSDKAVKQKAAAMASALPDSLAKTPEDRALLIAADIEAGRLEQASARLEKALALNPEDAALQYQTGMLRLKQHDPKGAIPALEKAAALEPKNPLYSVNLAVALLQAKEDTAARAILRRTLATNPDLTAARILLAQALVSADSLRAAEAEYRAVIQADPSNAGAFRGLGFCEIQRGAYADAATSYQKATGIEPQNADAWAGLGSAYLGLKQWNDAEKAFQRALSLDSHNSSAARGLELLKKARGQ